MTTFAHIHHRITKKEFGQANIFGNRINPRKISGEGFIQGTHDIYTLTREGPTGLFFIANGRGESVTNAFPALHPISFIAVDTDGNGTDEIYVNPGEWSQAFAVDPTGAQERTPVWKSLPSSVVTPGIGNPLLWGGEVCPDTNKHYSYLNKAGRPISDEEAAYEQHVVRVPIVTGHILVNSGLMTLQHPDERILAYLTKNRIDYLYDVLPWETPYDEPKLLASCKTACIQQAISHLLNCAYENYEPDADTNKRLPGLQEIKWNLWSMRRAKTGVIVVTQK